MQAFLLVLIAFCGLFAAAFIWGFIQAARTVEDYEDEELLDFGYDS